METSQDNIKEVSLDQVKSDAAKVQESTTKSGERMQLIVFRLGDEEYAMPIDHIKEVVLTPPIARIPQTPHYIKGVSNIRGTIIAIMDLEDRFGLEVKNKQQERGFYTLVIESEDIKVGILVTEVPNTLNTYESEIDNTNGIMQYSSLDAECIEGVVKEGNRLIMLVDIFKLLRPDDFNEISKL